MQWEIIKTPLDEIRALRTLFLQEYNFQFVADKCHYYGWADTYLFLIDGQKAGYGSVWGTDRREDRDTIFEYYLTRPFRHHASELFPHFRAASGAIYMEPQSNDLLQSTMLYQFATHIHAESILFEDDAVTHLYHENTMFRPQQKGDMIGDDDSTHVLLHNGEVVATGGLMLNYNIPFADMYMQVKEAHRRKGFGSLIIQHLKEEAYRIGRVPAARCNITNHASKATLLKAGMKVCGFRLKGDI